VILSKAQNVRLNTLDKILAVPELMIAGTTDQDMIYIHVLRFFGIPKKEVSNLYFHLSIKQFNGLWYKPDVDILKFDSREVDVEIKDYADLIIDFFI